MCACVCEHPQRLWPISVGIDAAHDTCCRRKKLQLLRFLGRGVRHVFVMVVLQRSQFIGSMEPRNSAPSVHRCILPTNRTVLNFTEQNYVNDIHTVILNIRCILNEIHHVLP
jgi:hypothetical protein